MRIITVSREFGSGGREVGKRLADELGFAYYDREIVTEIASKHELDESYVEETLNRGILKSIPIHFGRTFSYAPAAISNSLNLFVEQHRIIKELAKKGDCIIVGRAADIILKDYKPFNLFVYADMKAKIERCRRRASENEKLSERDLEKQIKKIDAERAQYYEFFSNTPWGDKAGYHLCVNTTDVEIKEIVPGIAEYAKKFWK
ncbi:MAG: cytidylate kinase-like family protein [Lachnospiraceae bacterium]|nr:cytidylate kinase-like family protein [Lachnospiraceae bacterium]